MANPSDELLARFLAGECDDRERADIARWVAEDPARQRELERLRVVFDLQRAPHSTSDTTAPVWDLDRARARVNARIDAQGDAPIDATPLLANGRQRTDAAAPSRDAPRPIAHTTLPVRWSQRPVFRIAAALVITVGLAATWTTWRSSGLPSAPAVGAFTQHQYVTTVGEQLDIRLPDSTRVILAPATTLTVAADYGASNRTVILDGEAWFDVRHDERIPFEVHANGTVTRDVGTVFVVRALSADTVIRVSVTEGQASLRLASAPAEAATVLNVNDVGTLTTTTSIVHTQRAVLVRNTWRDGQLPFDDASLNDVIQELRRWYGAAFVIEQPALTLRRLSATLPANDLDGALSILRLALGVDITHQRDTVTIR